MLDKIINLINYFRVARYSLYRELKFFYEPPPKKVSEIQNYELKSKIVSEILKFNTKCNYFYENLSIIKELKIKGVWKYYILKYYNINKNLFIFNSYIKLFYKNYTLVFATIYQLIT